MYFQHVYGSQRNLDTVAGNDIVTFSPYMPCRPFSRHLPASGMYYMPYLNVSEIFTRMEVILIHQKWLLTACHDEDVKHFSIVHDRLVLLDHT